MQRRSLPILLALVSSAVISAAPADTPDDVLANVKDGDARSTFAGFDNRIAVEAGDADAKVSIRVTDTIALSADRYFRWGVKAQAPFDQDKQDEVDIGTLSGLSSGSSASLDASLMLWPGIPAAAQQLREEFCEAELPKLIPGFNWKEVDAARKKFSLTLRTPHGCHVSLFKVDVIEAMVAGMNAVIDSHNAELKKQNDACSPQETCRQPLLVDAKAVADLEERLTKLNRNRLADDAPTIRLFTLAATANHKSFSYVLDTAPTEALKSNKSGSGVSIGYTEVRGRWLWSVGYSRERSYQGTDKKSVCTPIGTTGSTSCVDAAVGAPTSTDTDIAFAEARWTIAPARLAVSPRVEYDADASEWAVRLPIYLATNGKGELTGGIALGYTTDDGEDDEFGVAVFVGKAFDFFD